MVHELLQCRCSCIIIVGIQPKTRHISAAASTSVGVSASFVLLLLMVLLCHSYRSGWWYMVGLASASTSIAPVLLCTTCSLTRIW